MARTISATEAKNRFGSLLGWVQEHDDEIIVESHGEPRAVIMRYDEYEKITRLREQARRQELLNRLYALSDEVMALNQDLTPEEGDALADRFVRDVIDDMVAEGKIRFEP